MSIRPVPDLYKSIIGICRYALAIFVAGTSHGFGQQLDVPYVPTPEWVVERMLQMAQVETGDYVIDLGSGDGRIVIAAAKRGAGGHGVDLNVIRIKEARQNAMEQGVSDKVLFMRENIFDTDISEASVVTMYLLPSVNQKLRPRLFEMLEPGTRVVSHSFDMADWSPDTTYDDSESLAGYHSIYMWIMPANAHGTWRWETDGRRYSLDVIQNYQEVKLGLHLAGDAVETRDAVLRGKRFSFSIGEQGSEYLFNGRIEDDRISGYVQIRDSDVRVQQWTARRF